MSICVSSAHIMFRLTEGRVFSCLLKLCYNVLFPCTKAPHLFYIWRSYARLSELVWFAAVGHGQLMDHRAVLNKLCGVQLSKEKHFHNRGLSKHS